MRVGLVLFPSCEIVYVCLCVKFWQNVLLETPCVAGTATEVGFWVVMKLYNSVFENKMKVGVVDGCGLRKGAWRRGGWEEGNRPLVL